MNYKFASKLVEADNSLELSINDNGILLSSIIKNNKSRYYLYLDLPSPKKEFECCLSIHPTSSNKYYVRFFSRKHPFSPIKEMGMPQVTDNSKLRIFQIKEIDDLVSKIINKYNVIKLLY